MGAEWDRVLGLPVCVGEQLNEGGQQWEGDGVYPSDGERGINEVAVKSRKCVHHRLFHNYDEPEVGLPGLQRKPPFLTRHETFWAEEINQPKWEDLLRLNKEAARVSSCVEAVSGFTPFARAPLQSCRSSVFLKPWYPGLTFFTLSAVELRLLRSSQGSLQWETSRCPD
ncbi:unnamed protein product [Protopolystoma xenopodis]|uniref:Uncharacterized protein n=1 Tax=Protopolystoma xenopodis TaxID=117903 RepID=A0A3S5BQQ0_9PLAT|nr:unnamed protein product [Protopolystoma xenopodis]